jgi:hypothetical protein
MKLESQLTLSPAPKYYDSPIWMGVGVVSTLYEKDFPSEAEFLRAESRRGGAEADYFFKTNPQALAHIK